MEETTLTTSESKPKTLSEQTLILAYKALRGATVDPLDPAGTEVFTALKTALLELASALDTDYGIKIESKK